MGRCSKSENIIEMASYQQHCNSFISVNERDLQVLTGEQKVPGMIDSAGLGDDKAQGWRRFVSTNI